MRTAGRIAVVLAAALLSGCSSSSTAPQPLAVSTRVVTFGSDAERLAWPTTPTIDAGSMLRVRGWATVGCGDLTVTAVRRGERIDVQVTSANADRVCIATVIGVVPFESTIAVEAGTYLVRAQVVGLEGGVEGVVTVLNPAVP